MLGQSSALRISRLRSLVCAPGVRDGWRDDNHLARREGLLAHLASVLLANERGDVGLDGAAGEAHNDDSENEETQRRVGAFKRLWRRASNEDDMADTFATLGGRLHRNTIQHSHVDECGVEDRVETTEPSVRDDATKPGCDVEPESVELVQ